MERYGFMATATNGEFVIYVDDEKIVLNAEEVIEYEKTRADLHNAFLAKKEKERQDAILKTTLLERLNMTAEEVQLLFS